MSWNGYCTKKYLQHNVKKKKLFNDMTDLDEYHCQSQSELACALTMMQNACLSYYHAQLNI